MFYSVLHNYNKIPRKFTDKEKRFILVWEISSSRSGGPIALASGGGSRCRGREHMETTYLMARKLKKKEEEAGVP